MALPIVIADIRAEFLEFSNTPPSDASIQSALNIAQRFLRKYFGATFLTTTDSLEMQLYLTAHYLVIEQQQEAGDPSSITPTTSEAVGSVSASYAVNADRTSLEEFYQGTSYGQIFWQDFTQTRYNMGLFFTNA